MGVAMGVAVPPPPPKKNHRRTRAHPRARAHEATLCKHFAGRLNALFVRGLDGLRRAALVFLVCCAATLILNGASMPPLSHFGGHARLFTVGVGGNPTISFVWMGLERERL